MSRFLWTSTLSLCLSTLVAAVSCGSSVTEIIACTPGDSASCVGQNSCTGSRVCNAEGNGYGQCSCEKPPIVDAGHDHRAPPDAALDVVGSGDTTQDTGEDALPEAAPPDAAMCKDGGETACHDGCTNLETDPLNCGACGHDCTPGACVAGVCQPFTLSNDPAGLSILVVAKGRATWGNYVTGKIRTCLVDSCVPTDFATGSVVSCVAMDSTNIYWTDQVDPGAVTQCAIGTTCASPNVLTSSENQPWYIVSDSTNVYWTDFQGDAIAECAIGGCGGTPSTLATGQGSPIGLAVDSTNLYWTNYDGDTVVQCSKTDCSGTTITLATGQSYPYGITVTATDVYWVNQALGDSTGGSLMKCAIGGCGGAPMTLVGGLDSPLHLAVDATNIFWTNMSGTVMRCLLRLFTRFGGCMGDVGGREPVSG
jgi:hypothetical protein